MAKKLRISSTLGLFLTVFTAILSFSIPEISSYAAESIPNEEQWLMSVYQKGKEAYDRGDYAAAVAEWDKLNGTLERYPAFQVMVDYLKGRVKTISEEQVSQVDEKLVERQKTIDAIFQKGKSFYDQGRYEQAVAQWEGLNAYLPEDSAVRVVLTDFKKAVTQPPAKKPASSSPATMSSEESADMRDFFEAASKDFQQKALRAQDTTQSTDLEAGNALKEAYEKSKLLYYQGNYEAAMESLEQVASFFVQNAPERRAIDKLVLSYHQAVGSQKEADKVLSRKNLKFMPGDEFTRFVSQADEKFAAQLKETQAMRLQDEKTAGDEQILVMDDIKKGRRAFEDGRYDEALALWEKSAACFQNNDEIRPLIDQVKQKMEALKQIQRDAEDALSEKQKDSRASLVESLTQTMQEISKQLKSKTTDQDAEQKKAERALAQRRAAVEKALADGKKMVDAGKLPEAIQEWSRMLPDLEEGSMLKVTLQGLLANYEASLKAEQASQEAKAKEGTKLPTPESFTELISSVASQLDTQIQAANSRKSTAEQQQVDRRAFVSAGFTKGRALYDKGDLQGALNEWSAVVPELEEAPRLKPSIDRVLAAAEDLTVAQKAAAEAESGKGSKLKAPMDIEKLLTDSAQKLQKQTQATDDKRRAAEKYRADRQNILDNTFDKGKGLFEQGKFSEAVKQWDAMTSELQDGDKIKTAMKDIESSYQASVTAENAAAEAESAKDVKLAAPAELSKLLADLTLKIRSQTEDAASRKVAAEKVLADRHAKLDAIFAKGKLAADEGNIPAAVLTWQDMLADLEEGTQIQASLQALLAGHENSVKAQQAAREAQAKKDAKLATPDDLIKSLNDLSANSKAQTQLAAEQKQKAEQALEDRKVLVRNTYLKGKELFDAGKYQDALREWSTVLSSLEEGAKLQPIVDQAVQDTQTLALAQRSAAEAESAKDLKLKAPEDLPKFLSESADKLKIQIVDTQNQKKRSEEYLEMRKKQAEDTVQKGNALFEQGRWEEAKAEWLTVVPSLEDPVAFQDIVNELEKIHTERQSLQKEVDAADGWKNAKFRSPSDISKELSESRARIVALTQESEKKKLLAEKHLNDRQAAVQEAFDKGRKFFWDGKIADAVQQWASIEPFLEDQEMQTSIHSVTDSYAALLKSQQGADAAELKKDSKLKAPEELPKILSDARQIIDSQMQYSQTQKKLADQTYVDRQSLINSSFQKGKVLYDQDRIPEALEEWAAITPYLEQGSQIKQFIDNVSTNYDKSLVAKKVAEEAQVKQTVKFDVPPELSALLQEASQKLRAQVDDSKMQKEAAERMRADRQAFIDANFEKGKSFYEQGKISEAVVAWTALIPYIEDDAKIRRLILKVEENRRALEEEKKALEPVAPAAISAPVEFERALEDSSEKLQKSTKEKSRNKLERDVQKVIQNKKGTPAKKVPVASMPIPLDEIEQMMIEYNVSTPAEIQKRHEELKAIK